MASMNLHPEYASIIEKYTTEKHSEVVPDPTEDPEVVEAANVDRFGFYHPNGLDEKGESEENKQRQARRLDKWREMTSRWEEIDSNWQRIFRNGRASEKLTRRIFKGIPQQFRMIVWPLLLCVPEVKNKNKNLYSKMLNRALATSNDLGQIDLDINRTFRNTTYFRARYGSRQQALFRILAAYSVFNTEVGYCQGMSEMVGLLLTYIIEEEDAFWALSQLMTGPRHRLHGIFVSGFPGLQRLFTHHERVIKRFLPSVHKHFAQQQMVTSTYALKWFMQCFLDRLPVSLVLRLWDIYLLEGEKILIAMAYNILKMHKKRLLRMDQTQITCFFQDDLAKDFQFEDDVAIESLKECLEQLRRNKLDQLPPLTSDMLPRRSVGSLGPESVWQSQPNLRIHDTSDDDIHGPTMKPVLSVSTTDRHLRPRKREFTVRDVGLSPIPQRGPLKSQPISPVSLSFSSPGFARPASILTAAAVRNRYRTGRSADVIPQTASHSAPSDDLSNSRSPSASTTSSAFLSDTNYVPRQGSYPARSSPKFLRPRISNNQSRFFLDNQFSPTASTSTSGYATTEGRRHRALKDSVMNSPTPSIDIPSSFASTTTSSSRDRTLEPPQRSTPEPVNGVTLISVRPRQTADGQVVSQAVTKAFERIYVTKPPIAPHVSNGQVGQWSSSERTLYADPSTTHPPPSPLSYSASSASEQPWHRHPISVFRSESGHRASPTFGIGSIQQNRIRNTGVSRVELSTSQTREILIPVSQRSSSRPRVLRVDSFGRPLGMTNEVSPTESHLNQEPSRLCTRC